MDFEKISLNKAEKPKEGEVKKESGAEDAKTERKSENPELTPFEKSKKELVAASKQYEERGNTVYLDKGRAVRVSELDPGKVLPEDKKEILDQVRSGKMIHDTNAETKLETLLAKGIVKVDDILKGASASKLDDMTLALRLSPNLLKKMGEEDPRYQKDFYDSSQKMLREYDTNPDSIKRRPDIALAHGAAMAKLGKAGGHLSFDIVNEIKKARSIALEILNAGDNMAVVHLESIFNENHLAKSLFETGIIPKKILIEQLGKITSYGREHPAQASQVVLGSLENNLGRLVGQKVLSQEEAFEILRMKMGE